MRILESLNIAAGFLPVDLTTGTASLRTGDWVSLALYERLAVILFKDGGTNGEDVTLTLEQATDAAGTGAKALPFAVVFRKQAADLFGVAAFTRTAQSPASTYTNDTSAEQELIWAVEVGAEDLDRANGFGYVRAAVNDVGTGAQLGALLYLLGGPRYPAAPEALAGAIA